MATFIGQDEAVILPSALKSPTTHTVGFFHDSVESVADWLTAALGGRRHVVAPEQSLRQLLEAMPPDGPPRRDLLIPVDGWTAMLNDGRIGTDLGQLPKRFAERSGRRAIRATAVEAGSGRYPATILEVYEPATNHDSVTSRRTLFAANDGGTWRFGQSGEPFDFEDTAAYAKQRIRDRFTPEMLESYLVKLGVPVNQTLQLEQAVIVERPRPMPSSRVQ